MYCVYIIYSKNLDSYYVGETLDFIVRLDEHNAGKYQGSYTTKAKDWELFYRLDCPSREVARKIENHIKKMKSRVYFQNLKRYPEISAKLMERYS